MRTRGRGRTGLPGIWAALNGVAVEGYEIHVGTASGSTHGGFFETDRGPDGALSPDGVVAGTYMHGIFERHEPRRALVAALASTRGFDWRAGAKAEVDAYDVLADVLADTIDLQAIRCLSSCGC